MIAPDILNTIEPAAAAGDQCDKRTVVTNDLIAEINAANIGYRHDGFPFSSVRPERLVRLYAVPLKPNTRSNLLKQGE